MEETTQGSGDAPSVDDDVLREQSFKRAKGLNLDSFMVASASKSEPEPPQQETIVADDAAVGELADVFTDQLPSESPVPDTTTQLAVHGEQAIGKGLAVAMVVVWTAIGALVGTVLPPLIGAVGLASMALFGLYLGERWIRRDAMHLLGLTWVIISMKLLYGLALDLWRWGWLDAIGPSPSQSLGVLLLALVGLNVALAFRHDEDAIAAQSALVLFAVGSSAGAVYGEQGIAVFIVLAMTLMHGLAWVRSSGNLASLGISMSYLWVGVHALSNDWSIASLVLVPIEDGLVLFLLLSVVTAANAGMAAAFVHHENWLSQAFNAMGLGKPGLWAVSVSLGMVGALMAIAAHREETGYALAQLMLLTLAFSSSYLVVRGVSWSSLMPFVLAPMPFLVAFVALVNTGAIAPTLPLSLSEYSLFAVLTAALCGGVLLNHQARVSDHVLWLGSLVIVVLLTLLIPAEDGGSGSRLLLASQGVVWVGLAGLALMRSSPSMAGVAVLAPYAWLLVFATDIESRLVNADVVPIVLAEGDVGWWMGALVAQQILVCSRLGGARLNLGAGFAGLSEISGRLRDSEVLNLWNLVFFLACLTYLTMARPDGLTTLGLVGGMGALLVSHAVMVWRGIHQARPQTLVMVWAFAALALAWRFGEESLWAVLLTGGSLLLVLGALQRLREAVAESTAQDHHRALPGQLLTLHLGVMTGFFLTVALSHDRQSLLTGANLVPEVTNLWLLTAMGAVSLFMYLQRLEALDALLMPSLAAVSVLISMALAGQTMDTPDVPLVALLLFVLAGAYLAFQGDVRAGVKAVAAKEERLASFAEKRERMTQLVTATSADGSATVTLKELDAELLELAERQKGRAKRSDVQADDDLLVGDIHYRPVVLLLFLVVAFLGASWLAYTTAFGVQALGFSACFAVVLVGIARLRANTIGLRLPDVLGVELPIVVAMGGLVLVHVAGRMTVGVLGDEAVHQVVFMLGAMVLVSMGLFGRNDLGLRIPSALEMLLGCLVLDRVLCLLLGGQVPVPFSTDPFASTLMWTAPLFTMEVLLFGMVMLYDWVEGERLRRGLVDHRSAGGRSAWVLGTVMLSLGLSATVALLAGLRRARAWQQPAVALTVVVCTPLAMQALTVWLLASLSGTLTPTVITAAMGVVSLVWVMGAVRFNHGLWLASALWATHLMFYPSAVLSASLVMLSLAGLAASATAWLAGILTKRKSWRVMGAVDLVVAWMFAAVALVSGATSGYILVLLVASAALLFAVTTLTQANEAALLDD